MSQVFSRNQLNFNIVHELPGRLRARSRRPFNEKTAEKLCDLLAAIDGVEGVRASPKTGGVLVLYSLPEARGSILGALLEPGPEVEAARKSRKGMKIPKKEPFPLGGLIHYIFVRPLLPALAQGALAVKNGIPHIKKGIASLLKGQLNVDVLDGTAIAISLLRLDFRTAGLLALLLGIGDVLAERARKRSLDSLEQYMALDMDKVWIERDGVEERIPVENLREGDLVIARAGSVLSVDGVVVSGEGMVNQSSMTGEPMAIFRQKGNTVFAGTVLEEGELRIRPTSVGKETRMRQVVSYIEDSEALKSKAQSKSEHLADAFVPFTFMLAGLVWVFTGSFMRATSVLLVDYSCALRLAIPLSVLSAMREGATHGALIKGGRFLEILPAVDTVVFDKTGTLTAAHPEVAKVIPASGYKRSEILRLAACLEEHFPHSVARAVVRQAERENLSHREEHAEVEYIVAHGIVSHLHGQKVCIGSEHFISHDEHIPVESMKTEMEDLASQGLSILYLTINGSVAGLIGIYDPLRPDAAEVIASLRRQGIKRIVMLTGDVERAAAAVARKLGITEWRAEVLPADKAAIVQELKRQSKAVMMVGDGINDSPALSAADIGVALRDGADLARKVADVELTDGRLASLLVARILGRGFTRRIRTNFALIMSLNSIFLAGGLFGLLTPGLAALFHNVTTVGVSLYAMRPMLPPALTQNQPDMLKKEIYA